MKIAYVLKNKHAVWDENYLSQAGHFSHVNPGCEVSYSGETFNLGKMSHII